MQGVRVRRGLAAPLAFGSRKGTVGPLGSGCVQSLTAHAATGCMRYSMCIGGRETTAANPTFQSLIHEDVQST